MPKRLKKLRLHHQRAKRAVAVAVTRKCPVAEAVAGRGDRVVGRDRIPTTTVITRIHRAREVAIHARIIPVMTITRTITHRARGVAHIARDDRVVARIVRAVARDPIRVVARRVHIRAVAHTRDHRARTQGRAQGHADDRVQGHEVATICARVQIRDSRVSSDNRNRITDCEIA